MSSRGSSRRTRRRRQRAVGRTGARFPQVEPETPLETSAETPIEEPAEAAEPAEEPAAQVDEPEVEPAPEPEVEVEPEPVAADESPAEEPADPEPVPDDGHFVDEVPEPEPEAAPEPEPAEEPAAEVPEVPEQAAGEAAAVVGVVGDQEQEPVVDEFVDDVRSWVRPYVWTGGRTTTSLEFALETLVSARAAARESAEVVRDEHRQVLELCERPRSVSEIAALLSVPLGVAKALLGGMAEQDLLVVHNTSSGTDGPELELMERVLRGLRKL